MKRLFACVLLVSILLSAVSFAEETEYHMCDKFEYVILDDGTAEITFYYDDSELEEEYELIIPKTLDGYKVSSISYLSFAFIDLVTEIEIPEGVDYIGGANFYFFDDLQRVTIPQSVLEIGERAFNACDVLTQVVVPASVVKIGDGTFERCPNIMLIVEEGSYAEQYAIENGIPYQNK